MLKVLVIFGSMSSEHEISCISASNVFYNIDKSKYIVSKLGIDKKGNWYIYTGSIKNIENNKWIEDEKNKILINNIFVELKKYDVVLPILHGKYGEDGIVQGILEFAKVKYVGCKVEGSSIAMNKILSKELVKTINIPVVNYIVVNIKEKYEDILNKLNNNNLEFPIIVKPNKEGSSYGVTKVDDISKLKEAIEIGFVYDNELLIEKYISKRREIECAVLVDHISTPGEVISANEFYDFDGKYNNNNSYIQIPCKVNNDILNQVKIYTKKIFEVLKLKGISRIDFFLDEEDNTIYFNETNTMPGFTNTSMFPKMLEYDGIKYSKIIDILIEDATEN